MQKKSTSIRLSDDVLFELKKIAEKENRSVSNLLETAAIKQYKIKIKK